MKLAISNIAWKISDDNEVYKLMQKYGFTGLEIAPTRIISENPYDKISEAIKWKSKLLIEHQLEIPSMQSIWYGRQENLFHSEEERQFLLSYTKKAIDFAEGIECKNIVFGCPKNRYRKAGISESIAVDFFHDLSSYAYSKNITIGIEANPIIYHTNYINTTNEAWQLIEKVNSEGFRLNLDVGTMKSNGETTKQLQGKVKFISHVHISEPYLKPIENCSFHKELHKCLLEENYTGYISIEMGEVGDIAIIEETLCYIREVFGNE